MKKKQTSPLTFATIALSANPWLICSAIISGVVRHDSPSNSFPSGNVILIFSDFCKIYSIQDLLSFRKMKWLKIKSKPIIKWCKLLTIHLTSLGRREWKKYEKHLCSNFFKILCHKLIEQSNTLFNKIGPRTQFDRSLSNFLQEKKINTIDIKGKFLIMKKI